MKRVVGSDGREWIAELHDGPLDGAAGVVGWEAVVFSADLEVQRLVFRPAGWLAGAGPTELSVALAEAEAIRTRWQPAGG